ncbi:hypothetical protein E1263_08295 [Kribbella antibiotica]|uniref:Uncharacterized protein n=1 Tax=Kribbella antibiotica TaxID=190195 RepID=A0A4V2YQA6_9ACTN|nr:hypothetical protein [Kribbella antibiotica]TDD61177.1 hypothetical protein E1263_08295 [Kribbella antibiotica]
MTQSELQELIRTGAAAPLLAGTEIGPTWYDGQWWHIPGDAPDDADYELADAELSAQFDSLRRRTRLLEG